MVQINSLFIVAVVAALASASPLVLQKRIAQTIADSTTKWVAACTKAGGGSACGQIAQTAFTSLLAAGKNCDQQDAADNMVDLAKKLKNDPEMIRLSQLFVQQPRNAPDSLQVPYCQTAPRNAELNGLFHCQFAGSNFEKFSGDQTGNLPLGLKSVSPPGSCPAKKDGPVPDGVQLNTLVSDPGLPGGGNAAAATTTETSPPSSTNAATTSLSSSTGKAEPTSFFPNVAKPFILANGQAAIAQNKIFATLTPSSPCTPGENACVNGGFAQCVGGTFSSITQCPGGTVCKALPLVNKEGTSNTCTTEAEADARIAATGASA